MSTLLWTTMLFLSVCGYHGKSDQTTQLCGNESCQMFLTELCMGRPSGGAKFKKIKKADISIQCSNLPLPKQATGMCIISTSLRSVTKNSPFQLQDPKPVFLDLCRMNKQTVYSERQQAIFGFSMMVSCISCKIPQKSGWWGRTGGNVQREQMV